MVDEKQTTSTEIKSENLRFYEIGRSVPPDALKTILAGRLKGMSDVNPMWRIKRITEIFGPVGFGWRYTIDRQWAEAYGTEVKVFCNISLYVRDPATKEWSEAIPGCGGSAVSTMEKNGVYINDEAYKMALTDALSIAMKPLGIGADVWYGEKANGHNESKYENDTRAQAAKKTAGNTDVKTVSPQQALSEDKVEEDALKRIKSTKQKDSLQKLWEYYQKYYPSLCVAGKAIRSAVKEQLQLLNNAS